jgi:hypothetical protein
MRFSWLCLGGALVVGCQPYTGRPAFAPLPDAAGTEIRLAPRDAIRQLAEALRGASVPVRKILLRDAYLETGWFDAKTGRPFAGRPVGQGIVRVRGWADPARPGSSQLAVETSYRPVADPSLPERELERQVPRTHPVAIKVEEVLRQMVQRFGGPPPSLPSPSPQGQPAASASSSPDDQ